MNSGGFTEDDQAKIAEDVLGRVGTKRSGLGFSADAQPAVTKAFASRSSWFDQRTESTSRVEHVAIGTHDTTEGPFAWGAGQPDTSKAAGTARKTAPSRADSDPPAERVFPMVRDRDIETAARDRQPRRRGRSRSRSRSRSKGGRSERVGRRDTRTSRSRKRSRSRSRSRSNGRERREAERRRERQRAREKELQRERARDRDRQRERDRNRRSRSPRSRHDADHQRSKGVGKVLGSVPTAEQAKAAVKHQLRKATVKDTTLKTGAKSTIGGGAGWERPEMSMASDFFTRDEISSKGGVASVAPEYEARLAEILQVEDEDTLNLQKEVPPAVAPAGTIGPSGFDPSTQRHHDAIFAPTLSVTAVDTHAPRPASAVVPPSRVVGMVGAAARARLLLSGKLQEDLTPSSQPAPARAKKTSEKSVEHAQPREDKSEQPLFKTLRVGDNVEAQYTADDRWYKANILQTIHSGFKIARYKVKYHEYGNEETVGWTRIRRLESTSAECPAILNQVALEVEELEVEEPKAETAVRADDAPLPFAGMRPRQTRADIIQESSDANPQTNEKNKVLEVGDVVNPALRSATAGRKNSWKERVAAKKAGGSPGLAAAGVPPKKQISLVRDFATQRKEPGDTAMDTSEWRTKVVFGMGSSKKKR